MSSLSFPPANPLSPRLEASLSEMLGKMVDYCRVHASRETVGRPGMTWSMDLRQRNFTLGLSPEAVLDKLTAFTFTPYTGPDQSVVGTRLSFHRARGQESYFVQERIGFRGLQLYLSGAEFERLFEDVPFDPVTPEQWDLWGKGLTAAIVERYETVIYPRVVETLRKIGQMSPERRLSVMDVGGGSGTLAEAVCRGIDQVHRVVVVERSAKLIAMADRRAARHEGRLVTRRADVTADDFLDAPEEPPDVIILCGVVAAQVMDREQGRRLMTKCHAALPRQGFALVPSYSPALLSSRDYETIGFQVHNKTLNVIEDTPRGPELHTNDFYILEKP